MTGERRVLFGMIDRASRLANDCRLLDIEGHLDRALHELIIAEEKGVNDGRKEASDG